MICWPTGPQRRNQKHKHKSEKVKAQSSPGWLALSEHLTGQLIIWFNMSRTLLSLIKSTPLTSYHMSSHFNHNNLLRDNSKIWKCADTGACLVSSRNFLDRGISSTLEKRISSTRKIGRWWALLFWCTLMHNSIKLSITVHKFSPMRIYGSY